VNTAEHELSHEKIRTDFSKGFLISSPRSGCPVSAHALARTALNDIIFESNRGRDPRAAYSLHGFGGVLTA
jgi:hypothetical protein